MTLQELKSEAASLCDAEKGKLATDLLSMMKPSDYWVSDEEALERVRQLESGEVKEITFSELKKKMEDKGYKGESSGGVPADPDATPPTPAYEKLTDGIMDAHELKGRGADCVTLTIREF